MIIVLRFAVEYLTKKPEQIETAEYTPEIEELS